MYYALNKTVLGQRGVDIELKMKIHNVITIPTITYTSENWTPRMMDGGKINTAEMKYLKRIAGRQSGAEPEMWTLKE